jgi:hypothetical protein
MYVQRAIVKEVENTVKAKLLLHVAPEPYSVGFMDSNPQNFCTFFLSTKNEVTYEVRVASDTKTVAASTTVIKTRWQLNIPVYRRIRLVI